MSDVHGYCNAADGPRSASGDVVLFSSKNDRNAALARAREAAVKHGISESRAEAGIYPLSYDSSDLTTDEIEGIADAGEDGARIDRLSEKRS